MAEHTIGSSFSVFLYKGSVPGRPQVELSQYRASIATRDFNNTFFIHPSINSCDLIIQEAANLSAKCDFQQ